MSAATPPVEAGTPRFHSIQYLRGFAALAVVAFHLSEMLGGAFKVGSAGVDVFFVISGFIMWVTTAGRPIGPGDFVVRRLVRVVPLYWIVTLVLCLAASLKPQFFHEVNLSAETVVKSLLFIPIYQKGLLHPLLVQGWTLYYELFFYGVFALALLTPVRIRAGAVIAALLVLVILGIFADARYPVARNLTDPLLLEFAGGVFLGWLFGARRLPGLGAGVILSLAGLACFALIDARHLMEYRALVWGGPAMLLVGGALAIEQAAPLRPIASLGLLGDASYSIYLWHTLAMTTAYAVLIRLELALPVIVILTLAAAVAVPIGLYWMIEKPMVARLGAMLRRPHPVMVRPVES